MSNKQLVTTGDPTQAKRETRRRFRPQRGAIRVYAAAVVWLVASLMATGCSSSSEPESVNDSAPASFAERYLAYTLGTADTDEAAQVEQRLFNEIQNSIAACMKAEGFTYHPAVGIESVHGTTFSFTTEEEARAHGFGIVAAAREAAMPIPPNENDEYLMALDPAAQQAYGDAMDGDPYVPDDGCVGMAEQQAMEHLGIADLVAATGADFYEKVESDPRMVGAEQDWVACVRAEGFDTNATTMLEFVNEFVQEFQTIAGPANPDADLNSPEVAAFQTKEIEAALATLPCNQKRNEVLANVERELLTTETGSNP